MPDGISAIARSSLRRGDERVALIQEVLHTSDTLAGDGARTIPRALPSGRANQLSGLREKTTEVMTAAIPT
jgi:hypothetical protein